MGLNGSRVIHINKVEQHIDQCELLRTKSKIHYKKVVASTERWNVSATKGWSLTSAPASIVKHPTQCRSTTWLSRIIYSCLNLSSSKTSVPHLLMSFSISLREFVRWLLMEALLSASAETEQHTETDGVLLARRMKDGHTSKSINKVMRKECIFLHNK